MQLSFIVEESFSLSLSHIASKLMPQFITQLQISGLKPEILSIKLISDKWMLREHQPFFAIIKG